MKRHNERRHIQKGLVTHHTGKSHRNMHTLNKARQSVTNKGLLGMTELQSGRKGIRQSSQGTIVRHTHRAETQGQHRSNATVLHPVEVSLKTIVNPNVL